ncbi:FimD/PapC N-terminal domain-containing protein [Klebsiella variicola]|uniref:FimD/PapC N-terminal domain-containing protein n=1 Tax=Klebsiella variicola TaxID=244366 RepID=UPI0034D492EC
MTMISTLPRLTAGQALPVTRTVAGVLAALNLVPENVIAKEALWFPPALISGAQQNMAELGFLRLGGQMPGTYEVDIRVNGERRLSRPVTFRADEESPPGDRDGTGLIPCLTAADWATAGVREDILQRHVTQFSSVEQDCLRAEDLSPDVTATFGFQKMQLDLSIPRTLLATRPRGEIPPERWDEGISAAFLNYNLSGLQAHTRTSYILKTSIGRVLW